MAVGRLQLVRVYNKDWPIVYNTAAGPTIYLSGENVFGPNPREIRPARGSFLQSSSALVLRRPLPIGYCSTLQRARPEKNRKLSPSKEDNEEQQRSWGLYSPVPVSRVEKGLTNLGCPSDSVLHAVIVGDFFNLLGKLV